MLFGTIPPRLGIDSPGTLSSDLIGSCWSSIQRWQLLKMQGLGR